MHRLTTCSKAFDDLLGGGLETQSIVEFFGEFGRGKTQMCFQLAVNATMPFDKGGLDGDVVVIDTENTFRPERIVQISEALDSTPSRHCNVSMWPERTIHHIRCCWSRRLWT